MLPSHIYKQQVAAGLIAADPAQAPALLALDRLAGELQHSRPQGQPLWKRLLGISSDAPRGIYLYGPVGRGKSMLMDLLVQALVSGDASSLPYRRQHFYDFMREVHRRLARARTAGTSDPLALVTAEIVATTQLLCFDELFVKDVADAMILGRLFSSLIEHGVVIIFTSNCAPNQLYAGGLQRVRFLPFIDLLEAQLDIVEVTGAEDFRRTKLIDSLDGRATYLTPLSADASKQLQRAFDRLRGPEPAAATRIEVEGRLLEFTCAAGETLFTDFTELCERPLGPADMLEIAARFHTVILDGVPLLGGEKRNETTRFITLIDALYDAKRQLVIAAAAAPDALYTGGPQQFEFGRTASRLIEMQAASYHGL